MRCPDDNQLASFLEGGLAPDEAARVEEHLERCGRCRRLVSLLAPSVSPDGASPGEPQPSPRSSRFELIRELGAGAMGTVYEARDRETGDRLALKVLRDLGLAEILRFKRAFRAMAAIRHPNLVGLRELGQIDLGWYFTMDLVHGVDLLTHVESSPARRPERLWRAFVQLAEGLLALHLAGKVHQDIKPANVLVEAAGQVVLLDFGLVVDAAPRGRRAGGFAGTALYAAPEQLAGAPPRPAADWYAVGVLLYQALTGAPPFAAGPQRLRQAKLATDPVPPRALRADVPADLDALCLELLGRDPQGRPAGMDVLHRLQAALQGRGDPSTVHRLGAPGPRRLVGRRAELGRLGEIWDASRADDRSQWVLLHGPSGIGKTALVRQLVVELRRRTPGLLALRSRCHPREEIAWNALDGLVDELVTAVASWRPARRARTLPADLEALAGMFPVLGAIGRDPADPGRAPGPPDPVERRDQAVAQLLELLRRLARQAPLILLIDDLQWADADSLELLAALARAPGLAPLLIVTAFRDEVLPPAAVLARLRPEVATARVQALPLGPLTAAEADALAREWLGRTARGTGRALAEQVRRAGGHPLSIGEVVRLWRSGASSVDPGRWPGPGDPLLEALLGERISALGAASRRTFDRLCLAGGALARRLLRRAAELDHDPSAWRFAVADLAAQRLVRELGPEDPDAIEPFHDRLREIGLRRLDAAAQVAGHRALALALESLAPEAVAPLARHWALAEAPARALPHARRAAEAAADLLAFDQAAQLYRLALACQPDPSERARLGEALGDVLASAGRPGEAAEVYIGAAGAAGSDRRRVLLGKAARQWLTGGYLDRGLAILRDLTGAAGIALPRTTGGALRSLLAHRLRLRLRGLEAEERPPGDVPPDVRERLDLLFNTGDGFINVDVTLGADFFARHLLLALERGDRRDVAAALTREAVGRVALDSARIDEARALLARAERLARAAGDPAVLGSCLAIQGSTEVYAGRWDVAVERLLTAEAWLGERCHGVQFEKTSTRWFLCLALGRLGRLRELAERHGRYVAEAERLGDRFAVANYQAYFAPLGLVRDDPDQARAALEGLLDTWPPGRYTLQHFLVTLSTAERLLYLGDGLASWEAMERDRADLGRSHLLRTGILRAAHRWLLGRAAVRAAHQASTVASRCAFAARAAAQALGLRAEGLPHHRAWASLIEAGLLGLGSSGLAARALARAVDQLEAAGCRDVAAAARWRLGVALDAAEPVRGAEAVLRAEGVVNVPRFVRWLVPGPG
jgi:DNA polymerase III delta prime subunit